ncbi:hypothetical protein RND81_02G217500 [Saponaria officinalis]|uniref:Uncharacterized protein n=1 Tax=Saponaria officinalis TaxID=3572 RepID=A0AAW1MNP8_SAPOF
MKRPTNPMLTDFQITEDHILKCILQTARSRRQITDNQVISSMWPGTILGRPHYISYKCQEKNSYISDSLFQANLNFTLFDHFHNEAKHFGFSNFTMGTDDDQVYALYYCKGDIDAAACLDCVEAAAMKITEACKFWKEGIVWFEECTLRYANRTIFSIDEEDPYKLYYNYTGIVTEHQLDQYKQVFDNTMDALINQAAYSQETLPGFATKQINISSSEILECLAQCTPDIVGRPCYRCLRTALRLRDTWANTVVFLPSCLIRYDLYETVLHSPPSQPPPPKQDFYTVIIVVVVSVVLVLIVLALIGGFLLCRRPTQVRVPDVDVDDGEDREHGLKKFAFNEVEQMTNNFGTEIGNGACGKVYQGHLLGSTEKVAIKLVTESKGRAQFSNEIKVYESIRHKNIVSLLGYCQDETNMALVCEFMYEGDLEDRLSDDAGSCSLCWKDRLQIAIDVAEGLHYLHDLCSPRIMHRDVKPANILLHETNKKLHAKLADFGYSKIFPVEEVTSVETRVIGTFGYVDPEYLLTKRLNDKVDVYSFGLVLIQLMTGKAPSLREDVVESFRNNFNTRKIEKLLDSEMGVDRKFESVWKAAEVANSCVNEDPTKRPQMSQIVVDLKQSLGMELREEGRSGRMNPLVSGSISGYPEIQQISDTTSDDPKGKKILDSCSGTESPIVPPEARENPGSYCIGSTSNAISPATLGTISEDREGHENTRSCGDGSSARYITCPIVSDIVQEVPEEAA